MPKVRYPSGTFAFAMCSLIALTAFAGNTAPSLAQASTAVPTSASTAIATEAQSTAAPTAAATSTGSRSIKTVFLIMMENHDWSQILNNPSAPYINQTLLPLGAYANQYYNPPGIHPSEPNYLWLEAGTNFKILNDGDPSINKIASTAHLTTQLVAASLTWKVYMEGLDGLSCPQFSSRLFAAKHNPTLYFSDVTDNFNAKSVYCIAHERPYSELAANFTANTVPNYNFIVPNLCNDMHDSSGCTTTDSIKNGDTWLAAQIPPILKSAAYQNGGLIIITWDEGEGNDGPIGLIVLSKYAKPGYSNAIHYTHSSTLRTVQEIFGVTPLLGDAANATDLGDLFTTLDLAPING